MTVVGALLIGASLVVAVVAMTQPLWRKRPRNYTQEILLCVFGPGAFALPGMILILLGR